MPPKKKTPKGKPPALEVCCAICSNEVEKDEVATCVECKKSAHRYCAGVPIDEFESADGSYTCLSCLKKLHESKMADMSDCILTLKAEIVELREALKGALKEMDEVGDSTQTVPRNSSEPAWSMVVSRNKKGRKATVPKRHPRNPNSALPVATSAPSDAKVQRPKITVEGKRKVWGTLRTSTATAVKNTIRAITKIEGLDVKRKYHVKKTRQDSSRGTNIQLSKWWFVVSGEEPTLELLEKKWSAVNYQTNWTLEPVLSYCDSEPVIASQPGDGGQVSNQPTFQPPAISIAVPSEESLQQHTIDIDNPPTSATLISSPPLVVNPPLSPIYGNQ